MSSGRTRKVNFFSINFSDPGLHYKLNCEQMVADFGRNIPRCGYYSGGHGCALFCVDASTDVSAICAKHGYLGQLSMYSMEVISEQYSNSYLTAESFTGKFPFQLVRAVESKK
jgi:hypothetical protein